MPLVLAKASGTAFIATAGAPSGAEQNVFGQPLQPCVHEGSATGYFRNDMCHAPGDPNHHEVCANITPDFWAESGQGFGQDIFGKWCICVHKLGDWLRGASHHTGISAIDCNSTSIEALKGDSEAAKYIVDHCPEAVVRSSIGPTITMMSCVLGERSDSAEKEHRAPPTSPQDFL